MSAKNKRAVVERYLQISMSGNLDELNETRAAHEWMAKRLVPDATEAKA